MEAAQDAEGHQDGTCNHEGGHDRGPSVARESAIKSFTPDNEHPIIEDREEGAHNEDATHCQEKHEEREMSIITKADAVVDPRTMVVHLEHTAPAHTAMVSTCWFHTVTMPALLRWRLTKFLCLSVGNCLVKFRRQARISRHSFAIVVDRIAQQIDPDHADKNLARRTPLLRLRRQQVCEVGVCAKAYKPQGEADKARTNNLHDDMEASDAIVNNSAH